MTDNHQAEKPHKEDNAASSENLDPNSTDTTRSLSRNCSRRGALKVGAGLLSIGFGIPSVGATGRRSPWTDLSAKYELTSTSAGTVNPGTRVATVTSRVTEKVGDTLTVESMLTEDGEEVTNSYRIPIQAALTDRPKNGTKGGITQRESATVSDGWVDRFTGEVSTENFRFSLEFRLLERNGGPAINNKRPLHLLPLLVPPDVRIPSSESVESTSSVQSVPKDTATAQASTAHYANSRLTTIDNYPFGIETARSNFSAYGETDFYSGDFEDGNATWSHATSQNWTVISDNKTIQTPGAYARIYGTASYFGYFPLIPLTGDYWWDYHYHEHEIWDDGHYTVMTGEIANDQHDWKSHTFYDGSTFFSPGGLQSGSWYIV